MKSKIISNCPDYLLDAYDGLSHVKRQPYNFKLPCGGNRCNARCKFCPIGENTLRINTNPQILFAIYENLSKYLHFANHCCIVDWCEPMLSPYITKIIDFLDDVCPDSTGFSIVTNGIYLNQKVVEKLVHRRISTISVSLNASNGQTYQKLMGINKFNKVISNIEYLKSIKNINVMISMVLTLENYENLPELIILAKSLDINSIYIQDMFCWTNYCSEMSCSIKSREVRKIIQEGYKLARELEIDIYDPTPSAITKVSGSKFSCIAPWSQLNVSSNGDIRLCCFTPILLGNILKKNIMDIWNGETMVRIRDGLLSGRLAKECMECYKQWES